MSDFQKRFLSGEFFHLIHCRASDNALDLAAGSKKNGALCIGYEFRKDNENQRWKAVQVPNSEYFHLVNEASGNCLDLIGGSGKNGTLIVGWMYNGRNRNQMWKMIEDRHRKGYFYIQNRRSRTVIDLFGGSRRNGTKVVGWRRRFGNENQLWKVVFSNDLVHIEKFPGKNSAQKKQKIDNDDDDEEEEEEEEEDMEDEGSGVKKVKLKEKYEKLKDEKMCPICCEREKRVLFLPCKHLMCCEECSKNLSQCPFCRKDIKQKIVAFM